MSAKQAINDKLQGSVATYLRCGGIVNKQIKKGLLLSQWVKTFSKSVNIWQRYRQERDCLMRFARLANALLKDGRMNRRFCIQKGGSQEHISLITIMFCFLWICIHCPSLTQIVHKLLASFWYVCLLRLDFSTVVLCEEYSQYYFPF